jgi:dsRNA-specific ribonuclease
MNSAIFAIIGAITLQHGAAVASKIARERFMPGFEDEVVV